MTVPPGTFDFAISVTFDAVSPVRTVSSERCWPTGRSARSARRGADCVVEGVVVVLPLPLAALAIP